MHYALRRQARRALAWCRDDPRSSRPPQHNLLRGESQAHTARPGEPGRASVREPSQHVSQLPDVSTATTHGSAEPRRVPAPGQPGKPAHRTDAAPAPPHGASASGWVRASSDPTGSKQMGLATVAAEGIWALLPGAWPCSRLAPRAWARKRKLARPSLEGRSVVPPGRWWQMAQPQAFLMPSLVPGRRLRHSRRLPSSLPEAASWIQNPGAGFTQRGSGRTAGRVRLGVSVVVSSNDVLRTPPQASPPSSAPQAPGLSSVDGHHVSVLIHHLAQNKDGKTTSASVDGVTGVAGPS